VKNEVFVIVIPLQTTAATRFNSNTFSKAAANNYFLPAWFGRHRLSPGCRPIANRETIRLICQYISGTPYNSAWTGIRKNQVSGRLATFFFIKDQYDKKIAALEILAGYQLCIKPCIIRAFLSARFIASGTAFEPSFS
jgi:hypothetical protein